MTTQIKVYAQDREFLWKGQTLITHYFMDLEGVKESHASLDVLADRLAAVSTEVKIDYDSESRGRIVGHGFGGCYVDSIRGLYEQEQHELRLLLFKKWEKQKSKSNKQDAVSQL